MSLRGRLGRLAPARRPVARPDDELRRLQVRVAHLEAMVEGLQDAVHRESIRHEERMLELERKTEPESLAQSLSADARKRGL